MIIDHRMKIDGRWYKAGDDVPALGTTKVDVKVEKPIAVEPKVEEEASVEPTTTVPVKRTYTKRK